MKLIFTHLSFMDHLKVPKACRQRQETVPEVLGLDLPTHCPKQNKIIFPVKKKSKKNKTANCII